MSSRTGPEILDGLIQARPAGYWFANVGVSGPHWIYGAGRWPCSEPKRKQRKRSK